MSLHKHTSSESLAHKIYLRSHSPANDVFTLVSPNGNNFMDKFKKNDFFNNNTNSDIFRQKSISILPSSSKNFIENPDVFIQPKAENAKENIFTVNLQQILDLKKRELESKLLKSKTNNFFHEKQSNNTVIKNSNPSKEKFINILNIIKQNKNGGEKENRKQKRILDYSSKLEAKIIENLSNDKNTNKNKSLASSKENHVFKEDINSEKKITESKINTLLQKIELSLEKKTPHHKSNQKSLDFGSTKSNYSNFSDRDLINRIFCQLKVNFKSPKNNENNEKIIKTSNEVIKNPFIQEQISNKMVSKKKINKIQVCLLSSDSPDIPNELLDIFKVDKKKNETHESNHFQIKSTNMIRNEVNSIKKIEKEKFMNNVYPDKFIPKMNSSPVTINSFDIVKNLGKGRFGSVYLAKDKRTSFFFAIKVIRKKMIKDSKMAEQIKNEVKIQSYLDHPNILKMHGFFHDEEQFYLILEYAPHGELYVELKKQVKINFINIIIFTFY